MEQKVNKDKWIEETLSTADNLKRVSASPYIFPKILSRLKDNNRYGYIPVKKAAFGFLTIILLAIINIIVLFAPGNSQVKVQSYNVINESASQYIPSQYNPYIEILNNN